MKAFTLLLLLAAGAALAAPAHARALLSDTVESSTSAYCTPTATRQVNFRVSAAGAEGALI